MASSPRDSIKRGIFWLGSANVVMRLLELASNVVVWLTLDREAMGLGALAWSVAIVVEAFNGLAVWRAIVQAPELDEEAIDSLWWFVMATAVAIVAGVALGAPLIARYYGNEALGPLVAAACARSLFTGAAMVPLQLMLRALRFKEVALMHTAAVGLAAVVRASLALAGAGAWAPVLGNASEGLFVCLGVYLVAPVWPHLRFRFASIRPIVRFGARVAGADILYQGYRNLDNFIVGKVFGVEPLGVYKVAFDVAMQPATTVLDIVNSAAYPVYCRIQEDRARLARAFLWATEHLALLVAPVVVFLFAAAPTLLGVMAHGQWAAGAPIVQILAVAAFLRCLAQLWPQLFHATGHPELAIWDAAATFGLLAVFFGVAVVTLGPSVGAASVAWGWVACYPVILYVLWRFSRRLVVLGWFEYLRTLVRPLAAASWSLAVALPFALAPPAEGGWAAVELVALAGVVLGAHALAIRRIFGYRLRDALPGRAASGAVESEDTDEPTA